MLCRVQVVTYHGAKRNADAEEFRDADVVLTTYSTIENEYRRCACAPPCCAFRAAESRSACS